MVWRRLLDATRAISGNGRYREHAGDEVLALRTCAWRMHQCVGLGARGAPLFEPELPAAYRVRKERLSWTGRAIAYRWRGGVLTVDLRLTLPGPLLSTTGSTICIRWPSGSEPHKMEQLNGKGRFTCTGLTNARGWHAWIAHGPHQPIVMVPSAPVAEIRIISHMHWEIVFRKAGGRLLMVPLLDPADAPRTAARLTLWRSLASHPPLEAEEDYRLMRNTCQFRARFPAARLAPLPTWLSHGGSLATLSATTPQAQTLLRGWDGPYRVVRGNHWQTAIDLAWTVPTAPVTGQVHAELHEIPDELAYAGDATWEPGTVMDQLLALRTWAPYVHTITGPARAELLRQLAVPIATDFIAAVETIREPASGLAWGRWRSMWAHNGDACYDVDWYNGLALSGLARAVESPLPELALPARRLAHATRRERAALSDYFSIFQDWSLGTAWSDPRGWLWNADCIHNGLEGILAEQRLRSAEGNRTGANDLLALAARTAAGLHASLALPAWLAAMPTTGLAISGMTTFGANNATASIVGAYGVQAHVGWNNISLCTPTTRNPYVFAGHFPEWAALLRTHVNAAVWKRVTFHSEQSDWVSYYLGDDWHARRAAGDQEARIQAAVFYHLAPEVCFRAWVRGESGTRIAKRFSTPLNLVERILLETWKP